MSHTLRILLSCSALLLSVTAASAAATMTESAPSEQGTQAPAAIPGLLAKEFKIVVGGKSKSDGEIRFAVATDGGTPTEVRVTIQSGMGKQAACRDMAKELAVSLGEKFLVKHYDDDKVKLTMKDGASFRVAITGQSATGLSVQLK